MRPNKLNDLDAKSWLKFQKSWFVHNPPPRRKDVLVHPAKFPETLAQYFIEFFTKRGQRVLDPMAGTGSTLVACLRTGRAGIGIELNPKYVTLAGAVLERERESLNAAECSVLLPPVHMIEADAARIGDLGLPPSDYLLTSPPYWNMLRVRGAATQKRRAAAADLDLFYSDHPDDLGNLSDYDTFLERLCAIYTALQTVLRAGAYLTIIVKNVKKGGRLYPLAWDIGKRLGEVYTLKDERIWCLDNQRLAPYGLGSAWVSNTHHHYCLTFRHE